MLVNPKYHQSSQRIERELDWIQRAKDDPKHFAPLYETYYEAIFRYVYQRMDDVETAEDVTSQIFMKAMNHINKYEYRGLPFSSWLFRIAKSELNQAFRDNKAQRTVNVETVQLADMMNEMDEEESEMNRKKLLAAIAKLKDDAIQIIEMRFFEKRSFKEISEILNMTENNAKVKCFRALEKLKQHFL
jgi:RNA polymerase sigma-70 factor (ECF subfamily)